MATAGSTDTAQLDLEVHDVTTAVTLQVTLDGIVVASPAVVAVDYGPTLPEWVGKSWRARVPYAADKPGLYWHRWTVTGTGGGVKNLPVPVGPAADGADPRHTYATTTFLANYLHAPPPADADRMLRDAAAAIDDVLLCTVYDTDEHGMPTDPKVIKAFAEASCEQVKWRDTIGDDDSVSLYSSVSIGGVSLSRGRAGRSATAPFARLGPAVPGILTDAGLLGHGPQAY